MQTETLYEQDPYLREFTAVVTHCQPVKAGWQVVLDRTAFYPEGGGQPGDTGMLNDAEVWDTQEQNGVVVHNTRQPLSVGEQVTGQINWVRRFDHMQQHSGEHIVSGLIHARYGYDNVGFHLGAELVTIDLNGPLDENQLAALEAEANQVVWGDQEVQITWPDAPALAALEYRSKKALTGAVRIVTFPGADVCACCGTHVRRTGEIGLIKLLSVQTFRSGVRVEMVCGRRALDWLNRIAVQNHQTSVLLSAKAEQTAGAVRRLYEETQKLKAQLASLQERVFAARAAQLSGRGHTLLFEEGLTPDGVRRLCDAVLQTCGGRCAVFSGQDGPGYQYAIGQKAGDLRPLVKALNAALNGRGGGKPEFVQGFVPAARKEIEAFFACTT